MPIESVNKSTSWPALWHCKWEDLISREHLNWSDRQHHSGSHFLWSSDFSLRLSTSLHNMLVFPTQDRGGGKYAKLFLPYWSYCALHCKPYPSRQAKIAAYVFPIHWSACFRRLCHNQLFYSLLHTFTVRITVQPHILSHNFSIACDGHNPSLCRDTGDWWGHRSIPLTWLPPQRRCPTQSLLSWVQSVQEQ